MLKNGLIMSYFVYDTMQNNISEYHNNFIWTAPFIQEMQV